MNINSVKNKDDFFKNNSKQKYFNLFKPIFEKLENEEFSITLYNVFSNKFIYCKKDENIYHFLKNNYDLFVAKKLEFLRIKIPSALVITFINHGDFGFIKLKWGSGILYFNEDSFKFYFEKDNNLSLNFFDKYKIYFCDAKKSYPLSLKTITNNSLFSHFFTYYFEQLYNENYLIKDIVNDYRLKGNYNGINLPIAFESLENCFNKKQLLEYHLNSKLEKNVNKYPLAYFYYVFKLKKYLDEKDITKLLNLNNEKKEEILSYLDSKSNSKETDRLKYFLFKYCFINFEEFKETGIFIDYFNFHKKLKRKINLNFKSIKGFFKKHDELFLEVMKKQRKTKMIIKKENPFLQLKLPKKYHMIDTYPKLLLEGNRNKNCVATYLNDINNERCIIYNAVHNNKHFTLEILRTKNNEFYLKQIKGFVNSEAPNDLVYEINELLKKENKRLRG